MAMTPPASEGGPAQGFDLRLVVYVSLGLFAGLADVVFDIFCEARIGHGTLTGAVASTHTIVDRSFPIVLGGLLGVSAHYLRLRKHLASAPGVAGRAGAP